MEARVKNDQAVVEPKERRSAGAESIAPAVEAILMSADRPAPARRIAEALGLAAPAEGDEEPAPKAEKAISGAVALLNELYEKSGRSFRIEALAGGYRVVTLPEHGQAVAAFHRSRQASRLSKAGVETLAIIAYRQPITRAELERIRGVSCGEVLKSLLERRLITIQGRAEEVGRPMLYATTRHFLDLFGLATLKDLPTVEELKLAL